MKKQRGFTVIELIITVTIVGIVLAVGIPGFRSIVQSNRAATSVNNLVSAMNLARAEAIGRGQEVCVVPLVAGDWSQGWQVVFDTARDPANFCIDGLNDQPIRIFEGLRNNAITNIPNVMFLATGQAAAPRQITLTPANCTRCGARNTLSPATWRPP